MRINPFNMDTQYFNDLDDFKMPYALYTKTDYEVMMRRYQGLTKSTYGYIVRLGIPHRGR